jgi:hypothetical protein
VRLARTDVERVDGRQLSKGRTGLVVGIIALVAILIPSVAGSSGGGGLTGGGTVSP